jgi:hypothetical protein
VRRNLIRPPPLAPAVVTNRSAENFKDLFKVLRSSYVEIKDEEHRNRLLEECRYYRFRGLEQKLIAHEVSINGELKCEEICINLDDVRLKEEHFEQKIGYIFYKRPFADTESRLLIIQVKNQEGILIKRLSEYDDSKSEISLEFTTQALQNKLNEFSCVLDKVTNGKRIILDSALVQDASFKLDGRDLDFEHTLEFFKNPNNKRTLSSRLPDTVYLYNSQWQLVDAHDKVQIKLVCGEAFSCSKFRNQQRRRII